jgi:homoserine kinase
VDEQVNRTKFSRESHPDRLHLRVPATSANLGPCFDAAALALALYLEVSATSAQKFSIEAFGRDPEICGKIDGNLLIDTYCSILKSECREVPPLALTVQNGIPLGMGCGSSAAVRIAAVALAAHFGQLDWNDDRILAVACELEGHPDNAAACWLGGYVAATCEGKVVHAASLAPPAGWSALLALPHKPLATSSARAVLPENYSREDVVANLQRATLLSIAFAQGRGELLRAAMQDRIHQPYREEICPLLPLILPLAGQKGILGVALSGAGPAVLLLIEQDALESAKELVREATTGIDGLELLPCNLEGSGVLFL